MLSMLQPNYLTLSMLPVVKTCYVSMHSLENIWVKNRLGQKCIGSKMCRVKNVPGQKCAGSKMCRVKNVPGQKCAGQKCVGQKCAGQKWSDTVRFAYYLLIWNAKNTTQVSISCFRRQSWRLVVATYLSSNRRHRLSSRAAALLSSNFT